MLNGSLVSYSDSDGSEKEDPEVWIQRDDNVRVVVRQTNFDTKPKKFAFKFIKKPEQKLATLPADLGPSMSQPDRTFSASPFDKGSLMKKPGQKFYIPPGGRNTFMTFPQDAPALSSRKEIADSSSSHLALKTVKEAADSSTCSSTENQKPVHFLCPMNSSPFSALYCEALSVSDIPLPGETTATSSDNTTKSKKAKHAAMPVYLPPKKRNSTPQEHQRLSANISPDNQGDVFSDVETPKRRTSQGASASVGSATTTSSHSSSGGSGLKRKGDPLISPDNKKRETTSGASHSTTASKLGQESLVTCKRSLYSTLQVKETDWSSPKTHRQSKSPEGVSPYSSLQVTPSGMDEPVPKKVTLKPFWMFCPPPSMPLASMVPAFTGSSDVHGTFRSDYISLNSGPSSLPAYLNTSGSKLSSPHSPELLPGQDSYSSLPDMSDNSSTVRNDSSLASASQQSLSSSGWSPDSSWKWCYGSCSSAEVSPATSMSSISLDVNNAETLGSKVSPHVFRRRQPTKALYQPRQRIHSVPPRLRGRISIDKSLSTSLNSLKDSPPTSPSIWKSNFSRKYCNFTEEFVDSHCHLDFLYKRQGFAGTFQKYRNTHHETFPPNFAGCVAVFCEPHSFNPKGGLWKDVLQEDQVWVAMGCHPKCAEDYNSRTEEALSACLSSHPKVIAAGEFGLDYSGRFSETADHQKDVFVRQLKIALALDKPLVIHCRKAEDDTFDILEKYVPKHIRIHRHCFTDRFESAKRWLDTFPNLFVGLTPLVTYKSAVETHDLARKVPLDRLLLETDAPYFVPHCVPRGEMTLSHPGMAITVAEQVAYFRDIPVNEVLKATRENTVKMYGV